MRLLHIITFVGILFLSACAQLKYDPNKEYGFRAQEDETLFSNPEKGKSRIYFYRERGMYGALVRYNISAHYGNFDVNKPFAGEYNFAFFSTPGFAYFTDVKPNEKVILYAKTEAPYTFYFTPESDMIYCVVTTVGGGFFVARPYYFLVEESVCRKETQKLLSAESKNSWLQYKAAFEKKREKKASK